MTIPSVETARQRLAPQNKIVLHSQFADYMAGKPIYPVGIEVSPSGTCQASCPECLVAGTMIDTPWGEVPVERIDVNQEVWGPDGMRCTVTATGARLAKETVVVWVADKGRIQVTPEHPFLTKTGWKNAGDLESDKDAVFFRAQPRGTRFGEGYRAADFKLERGLEPFVVVCVERHKHLHGISVYNFSCTPLEAYEANGFVVHNCFYAHGDGPGDHRKVFIRHDRLLTALDEAASLAVKAITWTGGGEPSLHPKIGLFLERVHDLGMEQGMFTNALAHPNYDPAHLSWVRITATDKPFKVNHIKRLRERVKTLSFAFNYAGAHQIDYLWETLHLAEDVQADYVQVRPALRFNGETVDIPPPPIAHPLLHITDYKFRNAKHKQSYRKCEGWRFVPFLWETGDLDVCGYMRLWEGYNLGNIYKNRLKDIFDHAPPFVPVAPTCQVCCKLDEINQTIAVARTLQDVNFP